MGTDRQPLFKVTAKDFNITHIRGSGPGGQHRNKVATGVRMVHPASGAVAEACDDKSQQRNRTEAFRRIRETAEWKRWFREMCFATQGIETTDEKVARLMAPENITTQVLDDRQRWVTVDPADLTE